MITVMAIGGALRFLAILFSRMIRFHNACLVGKHVRKRADMIDVRRSIHILAALVAILECPEVRRFDDQV